MQYLALLISSEHDLDPADGAAEMTLYKETSMSDLGIFTILLLSERTV
jgi:hypothetical protein